MYKISTWNLERAKPNTKKTGLVITKILEEDSDIIILTETSKAVDLSSVYPYSIISGRRAHPTARGGNYKKKVRFR